MHFKIIYPGIVLLLCSSCSTTLTGKRQVWHFPYYPNVVQGNYPTAEQLAQLKVGQTKAEVQAIIGKPLSSFVFGKNERWNYFYQSYHNNKLQASYYLTLEFDDKGQLLSFIRHVG